MPLALIRVLFAELGFCQIEGKYIQYTGFELGKKSSFAKVSERSKDKSLPQAKKFLGFAKYFSEFAKLICEVCNHYFINFAKIFFVL